MTVFFPDLNVWLALSDAAHQHSADAWEWMNALTPESRLIFSRYTQLGLLRLLTNTAVMGSRTCTLRQAWNIYDAWCEDGRVELYPEPVDLELSLRRFTLHAGAKSATKWIGDCYLLAYAEKCKATLVTFDQALSRFGQRHGHKVLVPG